MVVFATETSVAVASITEDALDVAAIAVVAGSEASVAVAAVVIAFAVAAVVIAFAVATIVAVANIDAVASENAAIDGVSVVALVPDGHATD